MTTISDSILNQVVGVLYKLKFLFVMLALASHSVYSANCHQQSTSSLTKNLGSITVPSNLPIGGGITGDLNFSDNAYYSLCESTNTWIKNFNGGLSGVSAIIGTYNGRTTFSTNIPGVGVQIGGVFPITSNKSSGSSNSGWISNGASSWTAFSISNIGWGQEFYIHYSPSIRLIKTSNNVTGGALSGLIAKANAIADQGSAYLSLYLSGSVVNASCSLQMSTINVPLGTWDTSYFSNNQTTSSVDIPLQFNCPSSGVRVNATISANAFSPTQGIVNINTGSGTASGVGVQILNASGSGLPLNNSFAVGTSTQGTYNPGWKARYYKINATVTPGDANAMVTVSFNYQ